MTAASRPLSLRVEGVPQRFSNRLLVDLECRTDCPKTHPQPPQTRLPRNPLESERLPREHRERELQLNLRHGSNRSQSCPPNSRLKMASAAILFFRVPRMCRELASGEVVPRRLSRRLHRWEDWGPARMRRASRRSSRVSGGPLDRQCPNPLSRYCPPRAFR
jgi:hypothetical protein